MIKRTVCFAFIFVILISYSYPQKTPGEFFDVQIGADRTLVKYPKIIEYFKYIDAQSDRIKLVDEGLSTLKNPIYLAFINSE